MKAVAMILRNYLMGAAAAGLLYWLLSTFGIAGLFRG